MKEIKQKLIRWLGGVTEEELTQYSVYKFLDGKISAFDEILYEMGCNYGKPSDEWSKIIYDFAMNCRADYKEKIDDELSKYIHD